MQMAFQIKPYKKETENKTIRFPIQLIEDIEKARLIGIAHDIAKEIPRDKRVECAEKDGVILDDFEKRCKTISDGTWLDGWRKFCDSEKEIYIKATKSTNELDFEQMGDSVFAHYLDCEAHTDVWRELFKTANHRNEK